MYSVLQYVSHGDGKLYLSIFFSCGHVTFIVVYCPEFHLCLQHRLG